MRQPIGVAHHEIRLGQRSLVAEFERQLSAVDHWNHEAVAAVSAGSGEAIGVARFFRLRDDSEVAELAVTVVDAWQGRGVGTILTQAATARARQLQVRRFSMFVTRTNTRASRLLSRLPGDTELISVDGQAAEFLMSLSG